jgi:hypothetical protein
MVTARPSEVFKCHDIEGRGFILLELMDCYFVSATMGVDGSIIILK